MIFKTLLTSAAVSLAVASYAQAAVQDGTFEGTANRVGGRVSPPLSHSTHRAVPQWALH